jgi:hypothetical protein
LSTDTGPFFPLFPLFFALLAGLASRAAITPPQPGVGRTA